MSIAVVEYDNEVEVTAVVTLLVINDSEIDNEVIVWMEETAEVVKTYDVWLTVVVPPDSIIVELYELVLVFVITCVELP